MTSGRLSVTARTVLAEPRFVTGITPFVIYECPCPVRPGKGGTAKSTSGSEWNERAIPAERMS